jgi:hypothetical protein
VHVHRPEQLRRIHSRIAATASPLRVASSSVLMVTALGLVVAR